MEERIEPQRSQAPQGATTAVVPSGGGETVDLVVDYSDDGEESESEFEFPFVSRDVAGSPAPADDLFADGRIRPFYPVFGRGLGTGSADGITAPPVAARAAAAEGRRIIRGQLGRLFLEESRERDASSTASTTSSSTDDDLEGAPPESYCVWAPTGPSSRPPLPRKSGSTGSMARWRRISDLVVGRSHSDGKEKFLFLPVTPPPPPKPTRPKPKPSPATAPAASGAGKKKPPPAEVSTAAAAHRIAYGGAKASAGLTPRRTFLPYREELVGFFANVNGISRSHPYPY